MKASIFFKVHSHITSAFAFFFDLCRPVLENANVSGEHYHFFPWNPLLTFDTNASAGVMCEQSFSVGSVNVSV